MIYKGKKGQFTGGKAIGILTLESSPVAFIPGDVNNATSYGFPVRYQNVEGLTVQKAINRDPSIYPSLKQAAEQLVAQGVRAITGGCGFMGMHQPKLADEMDIPIFLSSLMQIPFITGLIGNKGKIGIVTADSNCLAADLLEANGVFDTSNLIIEGLQEKPNFYSFGIEESGKLDSEAVKEELIETAQFLVNSHQNIKALLLECSLLPPYSAAVQKSIGIPVFDYMTMINFVFSATVQKEYNGFL